MCLRAQVIDDNKGVVARVRQAHGLSNDDGGAVRGRGIDDASEGLETTAEASTTTTEALTEEYDPEVSTTTTEASA